MNRFTRRRFSKSLIFNIICLTSVILSGCASYPAPKYVLIDDGAEKVNFLPEPIHPLDQPYKLDEDFAQLNESQIRVDKAVSEFNEKYIGSPIIVVDDHEVIKFHDRFTIGEHKRWGDYSYNYEAALALGREGRALASFFRSDGMPLEHVELAKVLYKYKWMSLNEGNPNYDEALPLLWGAGGAAAGAGGGGFAAAEICEGFVLLCIPMVGVGAVVGGVGGIAAGAAESERRQEQRNYVKSESNKQYWELLRWALSNDEVKRMLSDDGYEDLAFNFSFPNRFECTQASDRYAFTGVTERPLERQYEGPNGGSLYDALVSNNLNPYEVCIGDKIPQHQSFNNGRAQYLNIKTHWAWNDYGSFQKENSKVLVRVKAIAHLDDCRKNTDKIELYTDKLEPIEPLLHTCIPLESYTSDNELKGNANRHGLISYFLLDLQSENDCVAFLGQVGDKSSNKILRFPIKLPRLADGNSMTTASSEFCQRTVSLPTVDEIPIPEILYKLPSNLFLSDNPKGVNLATFYTSPWKPTPYDHLVTFLPETWCVESIDGVIDYSECAVFDRGKGEPMYQGQVTSPAYVNVHDLEIEGYRYAEGCSATLDEINDTCSRWKIDFNGGYLDTLGRVEEYGYNTGVIWMWYVRSILEPLRPGAWVRDDSKYWQRHPDAVFAKFPDGRVGFVPKGTDLPDELKVTFKDPYDFVVPGNTWKTPSAQIPPLNMMIKTPY